MHVKREGYIEGSIYLDRMLTYGGCQPTKQPFVVIKRSLLAFELDKSCPTHHSWLVVAQGRTRK